MSRFIDLIPLVNIPLGKVPNIFSGITNDPQSLVTTLGYIDDLAYPPNITTPEFVSPPIPLLKENDILYIITSFNATAQFGVYFVNKIGNSFQLVSSPSEGNIQPLSPALTSISGLTTAANQIIYTTAPNTYATSPITSLALTLLSNSTTAQMQATLGIITLIPSDPLKTFIASVDSPVVVGQLARFSDVNGTVQASGILVTDILLRANNLNDLTNIVTARFNLGLGSAAIQDITFFLQSANNLSDVANAATARTNLGLGTAATQDNSFFLQVLNNLSDLNNTTTARLNLGLGTAAIKAASDATKPFLASINGSTTINNVPIFSDTLGTLIDSGLAFTGFQPSSPALTSIAGLATVADQMLYTTAPSTYAVTSITSFSRGLLALANAAAWQTGLGLGTAALKSASDITKATLASINGSTVINNIVVFSDINGTIKDSGSSITSFQPLSAALTSIAGLITSANQLIYTTASNTYAVTSLTAFSRTLLTNSTSGTWQTTLGLGTAATKAVSDNTKATVASVNSTTVTGHVATFSDTAGTITDGGVLGTAAAKAASDNTKATLASTSGAFIVNNIVVAADTTGTIKDGGLAISGLVPTSRTLTAAGLVTGGGDLSADRSFTVTAATQTTQEAATSNTVAVTPGTQIYHPSSIKASGTLNESASPSWLQEYNFTTITRNAAGNYTLTMSVTFSNTNYQVICTVNDSSQVVIAVDQKTTTSFRVRTWTLVGILLSDADLGIIVTGDLA